MNKGKGCETISPPHNGHGMTRGTHQLPECKTSKDRQDPAR